MKYIRTKDEIYEIEQTLSSGIIFNADCLYTDNELIYDIQTGFGIIAKANTIEELCDTWLIVPKERKFKPYLEPTLSVFDDFEDVLKCNDVYCAIWVFDSNGAPILKPVAKINNERVSKLL